MTRIDVVEGRAVPVRGDDLDTDRIIPARFLKAITFDGLEQHLFEDDRAASSGHPLDDPRYAGAAVMLVNRNFGCGSSREHAPQAIYRRGVRAIVGESFSDIFFGNATALGLACVTVTRADAAALMDRIEANPRTIVRVDVSDRSVRVGDVAFAAAIPDSARDAFLMGTWDATAILLRAPDEVDAVAARLPYLRW